MTTSPSEPVENDQSGSDHDDDSKSTEGIDDSQLPEDLQPDRNPLASEDGDTEKSVKPDTDDVVPEGEAPPGDPSIG